MSRTTTLKIENSDLQVNSEDLINFAAENDQYEPSEQVIKNILGFSKALEVKPSKSMKHFETVLN